MRFRVWRQVNLFRTGSATFWPFTLKTLPVLPALGNNKTINWHIKTCIFIRYLKYVYKGFFLHRPGVTNGFSLVQIGAITPWRNCPEVQLSFRDHSAPCCSTVEKACYQRSVRSMPTISFLFSLLTRCLYLNNKPSIFCGYCKACQAPGQQVS